MPKTGPQSTVIQQKFGHKDKLSYLCGQILFFNDMALFKQIRIMSVAVVLMAATIATQNVRQPVAAKKVRPPKRRARARTRRKAKKTAVTRSDHPSAATQHNSPFRLAVSDIAYRHSATIQEHQEKQLLSRGLEPLL